MIGAYKTRNGTIVEITGISQYTSFGKMTIILSGTIDNEIGSWDELGRYKLNEVLGIEDKHPLDIVESLEQNGQEGHYFTEEQIKRMI